MKYQNIFYTVVIASAFAACSQLDENEVAGLSNATEEAAFIGGDSEMEIRLSTGGNTTRGISYDGENFSTTDGIGVFMLATDITTINPEASPLEWKEYTDGQRHAKTMVLKNVRSDANIVTTLDEFSNPVKSTELVWAGAPTPIYYYPIDNWYAFRFYGYHPYQSSYTLQNGVIKVTYPQSYFDGSQDIIYGYSKKGKVTNDKNDEEKWRYSAKYIRKTGDTDLPKIQFKHKLMGFQFKIKGEKDYNGSYADVNKITVKSITVGNVPVGSATLTVANLNNITPDGSTTVPSSANDEGYLSFNWNNGYRTLNVKKDGSDQIDLAINASDGSDPQVCGDTLFLPVPPTGNNHIYTIDISLHFDDGSVDGKDFGTDVPLQLQFDYAGTTDFKFEEGKIYDVVIKIAGPQSIQVKASLSEWEPGGESDEIELN